MSASNLIQLLVFGALAGLAAKACFIHDRVFPLYFAAAVGAAVAPILGLIFAAAGLDNGLGFILVLAGAMVAVMIVSTTRPRPTISTAPKPGHNARPATQERAIQYFDVDNVAFYDGVGHGLGPSQCTITTDRLIIDGTRGGMRQILLRDISGLSTPGPIVSPKQLRISLPTAGFDVYCNSKAQKLAMEDLLNTAIRGGIE
jgi:hypothetical protein